MKYRYLHFVTLIILSLMLPVLTLSGESSQSENGRSHQLILFPSHPISTSYTWETHSTVNRFELAMANVAPPQYPWLDGFKKRVLLDIQLGVDIPIIGGETEQLRWYVGFPISFRMINDFFEPMTAPVMNTNYWFGTKLEVLYRIQAIWPGNIYLRVLPIFHESTHIGDEMALHIKSKNPTDFYRIKVSYEAWEIMIGLNEWELGRGNTINIRIGMNGRWNADGYYNLPQSAEIGSSLQSSDIIPSRGSLEYFGQVNTIIETGFPAIGSWYFQGGLEARNRILFDYFSSDAEKRVWTVSSSIGWFRHSGKKSTRKIGFYLTLLGGQNPHGQFREQNDYWVFGTGLSLGL